jgi:hypothetical protein
MVMTDSLQALKVAIATKEKGYQTAFWLIKSSQALFSETISLPEIGRREIERANYYGNYTAGTKFRSVSERTRIMLASMHINAPQRGASSLTNKRIVVISESDSFLAQTSFFA